MLFWSLKVILFSLVFIFIIHHLLQFFKSNLTIPKTKEGYLKDGFVVDDSDVKLDSESESNSELSEEEYEI